jgi:DNA topoisomerase-1
MVAGRLGNTRAVCRKCYIHPAIFEAYLDGTMRGGGAATRGRRLPRSAEQLTDGEAAVLGLLQRRLESLARKAS